VGNLERNELYWLRMPGQPAMEMPSGVFYFWMLLGSWLGGPVLNLNPNRRIENRILDTTNLTAQYTLHEPEHRTLALSFWKRAVSSGAKSRPLP
jgi:hypothetical protein